MEVYWSIEDVDMQAPQKQLRPNVKRINSVTKELPKNNLAKEKQKSVVHEGKDQIEADKTKDENTNEVKDAPKALVTLKDLCAEDKQRVANLIKELARVDGEKANALSQLAQQKASYEDQARTLATEREKMRLEREGVETQLRECRKLLDKYEKKLKEQQEKKIIENLAERVRTNKAFPGGNHKMDSQNSNRNPVTKVMQPLLHQLPTDVKCNHFAGNNDEKLRRTGNQIVVVPNTLPHLAKSELGTGVFPHVAPMMLSHSGENPIGYKLTSNVSDPIISFPDSRKTRIPCPLSRPDLSSTRYSDEEFSPERSSEPARTGVRPMFSGTGDDRLSSENLVGPEKSNQRIWDFNHNFNHFDGKNVVDSSRCDAFGGKQFGQFGETEAGEGDGKIFSAESLGDERERLREVLQNQRKFLKKQEQELRLLFDAQHLSSTGFGLGTCSYNGRALVDQRPDVSALRPKPLLTEAHTVDDGVCTEHVMKSVSVGTSPLKFETSKKASSETEVSMNCNEPSIPLNANHRNESRNPPFRNETKCSAQFPKKKRQTRTNPTVRFEDSATPHSSTGRHRNGREHHQVENDSDSSLEESKIIDELFFVK